MRKHDGDIVCCLKRGLIGAINGRGRDDYGAVEVVVLDIAIVHVAGATVDWGRVALVVVVVVVVAAARAAGH